MLYIKSIPAFDDNYIWLIQNNQNLCAVVDPGDATPVLEFIQSQQLELTTILVTHHHNDHTGGIEALRRKFPSVCVIGPKASPYPNLTHRVSEGHTVNLFNHELLVLDLPGHTLDHIGYFGDGKLFCGDVLFSAGCGRVFEGTTEQMYHSLQKLSALDDGTEVYCAHEYTLSNLAFALAVEPHNASLQQYRDEANQKRAHGIATIPTTIGLEKHINPFLRVTQPEVMQSVANKVNNNHPLSTFTALRAWKNDF